MTYNNKRNSKKSNYKGGKAKGSPKRDDREGRYKGKDQGVNELLDPKGRDNDPNWYFTDAALADQVSQLSFQQLAGFPVEYDGKQINVPNLVRIMLNPSPGVIKSEDYENAGLNKTSGINLAGFKVFSKLSAFTGRVASYGPQDISIMILAFGEIISITEWCRRTFGIANASSMRNRDFPRAALSWALGVDDDDFFKNYSNYRTRFNGLITMINQLPIPKGISYFDKCASLYEKVYTDAPSSMAQSLFTNPFTTWVLNEEDDERGSYLETKQFMCQDNLRLALNVPRKFSEYLDTLDVMISAMLNSSSLQTVYTDLLNLSVKMGQEFWKLDYLVDGYIVVPEYNANFMLQMHNSTVTAAPDEPSELVTENIHVTAMNDVVMNDVTNTVYYNPGFPTVNEVAGGLARTGRNVIIDMLNDAPTVVDRVEATRYTSISGVKGYGGASGTANHRCNAILPDHYVVFVGFKVQNPARQNQANQYRGTIVSSSIWSEFASFVSVIDWAPRFYEMNAETNELTGNYTGDFNFYTIVDEKYLLKLHQFMTLGLYELRK